jgi:uncharacterized damage-inducible protein DinB
MTAISQEPIMNQELVQRYAAGASQLAESIAGLTPEQLNAFPVPGTWSIQQIVLHLMDSDLIAADRMKRVAAENSPPTLLGYDETAYARVLPYDQLDPHMACEVFEKNRLLTAEILKRLPDATFGRTGNHNERGTTTLAEFVRDYSDHLDHHLKFIRQKRELLGCAL